jgi:hypothetical protein
MIYFVSLPRYLVFDIYDLVTYFVFCSIPLFYGLIFYLKLKFYIPNLLITTTKELRSNQLMFLLFLLFGLGICIFLLGSLGIHHYENILKIAENLLEVYFIPREFLICLGLAIFVFLMMVYAYFYTKVNKILLTLFLYYYQYDRVKKSLSLLNKTILICMYFFADKVYACCEKLNFSKEKSEYIYQMSKCIWPMSFRILKKYLYVGIIPYTIWFDIETQNYCLTHVFQVLPWYFLYSLLRGTHKFIVENKTMEGMCFTSFNYKIKNK